MLCVCVFQRKKHIKATSSKRGKGKETESVAVCVCERVLPPDLQGQKANSNMVVSRE